MPATTTTELRSFIDRKCPAVVPEQARQTIVERSNGDVRQAARLLDLEVRYRTRGGDKELRPMTTDDNGEKVPPPTVTRHSSLFDKCNALLGVAGSTLPARVEDAIDGDDEQESVRQMMYTHYMRTLPKVPARRQGEFIEPIAEMAEHFSIIDRMRYASPATARQMTWLAAATYRRRTTNSSRGRQRPSYKGPLVGALTKRLLDARSKAPRYAVHARRYEMQSVHANRQITVSDQCDTDAAATKLIDSPEQAMLTLHRQRFDAQSHGAKPSRNGLLSPETIALTLAGKTKGHWTAAKKHEYIKL
jgi:hypothetical protein